MSTLTIAPPKSSVSATGQVVEELHGQVEGTLEFWTGTIVGGHQIEASFELLTADLSMTLSVSGSIQDSFELFTGYIQGGQQLYGVFEYWEANLVASTSLEGSISAEFPLLEGSLSFQINQVGSIQTDFPLWSALFEVEALLVQIAAEFPLFTGLLDFGDFAYCAISTSIPRWQAQVLMTVSYRGDVLSAFEPWTGQLTSPASEQILQYKAPHDYLSH